LPRWVECRDSPNVGPPTNLVKLSRWHWFLIISNRCGLYEAGRTIESVRKQYGLAHVAKLASNENPLGASPTAVEAIGGVLGAPRAVPQ
jgi:hypothetical protein